MEFDITVLLWGIIAGAGLVMLACEVCEEEEMIRLARGQPSPCRPAVVSYPLMAPWQALFLLQPVQSLLVRLYLLSKAPGYFSTVGSDAPYLLTKRGEE